MIAVRRSPARNCSGNCTTAAARAVRTCSSHIEKNDGRYPPRQPNNIGGRFSTSFTIVAAASLILMLLQSHVVEAFATAAVSKTVSEATRHLSTRSTSSGQCNTLYPHSPRRDDTCASFTSFAGSEQSRWSNSVLFAANVGSSSSSASSAAPGAAPGPGSRSDPSRSPASSTSYASPSASSSSDQAANDKTANDDGSSSSSSSSTKNKAEHPPNSKRSTPSLYSILRSSPTASRSDLKRAYVALARETHPDALVGRSASEIESIQRNSDLPSFHEIAEAWRILSNPVERKRYDRSLQADEFVENAERWATVVGESTGKVLGQTWNGAVLPTIQRTVSTVSSAQNAFRDELGESTTGRDGKGVVGVGEVWKAAVGAAKRAGRNINRQDMLDKSAELEERAQKEMAQAESIRDELAAVNEQRLKLALNTPNAALSSLEAMQLLGGMNIIDRRSIADFVQLRQTVASEIDALEKVEASYYMKSDEKMEAEKEFQRTTEALRQAKVNAESAVMAERRAQQALKAAQELVASTKRAVKEQTDVFSETEVEFLRRVEEAEKLSSALERRQERVRRALRRKEDAIRREAMQRGNASTNNGDDEGKAAMARATEILVEEFEECSADEIECNKKLVDELRKKERFLMAENARLENRAGRLQSRADKLKARADFMLKKE